MRGTTEHIWNYISKRVIYTSIKSASKVPKKDYPYTPPEPESRVGELDHLHWAAPWLEGGPKRRLPPQQSNHNYTL